MRAHRSGAYRAPVHRLCSPALSALLPYRTPTPGSPGPPIASPPHSFASSSSSIHLPMFAPSAWPAAGLPVRLCLRPPHRPPQVYLSASVCALRTARHRSTRPPVFAPSAPSYPPALALCATCCSLTHPRLRPSRCCRPPPTPLLQYLFLQTYPPTIHHPGTSPYFSNLYKKHTNNPT
ncbi:hypothetical protein B0H14DRAFT_3509863 [Mycena olivaceomarginata]|nr:hypothetical protein B0H14DRAFT_3509863 [Mycena olivaceomarginata]